MTQTASFPSEPIALVPATAPFNEEQRGWLNGFFAGLLNGALAGGAVGASAPIALAPEAEIEEETPWHDPALPMDERLKLAEGKRHPLRLMAAMAQLDCGSCGYVCKTYAEALASGTDKDFTKCTPGGRETTKMLKVLHAEAPKDTAPPLAPSPKSPAAAKPAGTYDRTNPYGARLLSATRLNGPASAKDTRHVVINLKNSGITYRPGDALGVYPENCSDHVEQLLQALGATGAEEVTGWDDQPTSFREALQRDFTITRPSPDLLDLLSRSASNPEEREALAQLRDGDDGSGDLEILDLLLRFPSAKPAPGDFLPTLSPLVPRLYSISSSLAACPETVHLTVGTVRYENSTGRSCKGVASTFLADRLRPGHRVRVFVQPSHRFGLPAGDKPIIMVGPGTGVAPFRSFLQERRATSATGKSWLFFGDQTSADDFLYREELEGFLSDGTLTRLDTAFSRDGAEKVYVQHRMLEHAGELWAWLEEGAHFYVCGDAKRMASDVDKAIRQVIVLAGRSAAEADTYVAEMARAGRYQRDVY
jgi:sulfite reductase (NADPH) flavoprotein alpha-component